MKRQQRISTKLLGLSLGGFITLTMTLLFLTQLYLTDIIDSSQEKLYHEKLMGIQGVIVQNDRLLQKTALVEVYGKSFKKSTLTSLRESYFKTTTNGIIPFIIDKQTQVIFKEKTAESPLEQAGTISILNTSPHSNTTLSFNGNDYWYIYQDYKPWGWRIGYLVSHKVKYNNLKQFTTTLSITMLVAGIISLIIIALLVRQFTKPLTELTELSSRIAEGDLNQHITISTNDEVSVLAHSFSVMQKSIKEKLEKLDDEIKEHKKTEYALHQQEENLENLVDERTKELESTQGELVEYAHQAGMAEMATGVLHNIGNILTGVSVSADTLDKRFFISSLKQLRNVAALLDQHKDDMTHFLTTDTKAQNIPHFFIALSKQLDEELNDHHQTIEKLNTGLGLIKETVQMQQSYAHCGFFEQNINLQEIAEGILKLYINSIERENITVQCHFEPIPSLKSQRNKIGHILSNLIKNARDATRNTEGDKSIVIKTGVDKNGRPFLSIQDSGCGFSSDIKSKIFTYGFTTKENGNGFGLHHSANAMTEMNGQLKAFSAGPGKGATFTILFEVPNA